MSLRAGFAEVDITPPLGTKKIGWLREIVADTILDPLHARIAIIESGDRTVAFVQLDTLSIRWTQTNAIREEVAARYGYPGDCVMAAATHNHAGPAVANAGEVRRDEAYLDALTEKIVSTFGQALDNLQEAEAGFGSCFEFNVAHNRRVVMRDGTVRTHGTFDDPDALCIEGPIDPELAVLAVRGKDGGLLGCIVNYACHPAHHGGGTALSGGFPGVLASVMKENGCPVTLFLNGACGDLHTSDPSNGGVDMPMEEAGRALAEDALKVVPGMQFRGSLSLGTRARTVDLPYRELTDGELRGMVRGAQRFVDPAIYERTIPKVAERIRTRKVQPAEVQVHFLDEYAFVSLPGECFVELGLRIKKQAHPRHALAVSHANGMVGYVPHEEAFARGGYETTFAGTSRMAPETGGILVECARGLMAEGVDGVDEVDGVDGVGRRDCL